MKTYIGYLWSKRSKWNSVRILWNSYMISTFMRIIRNLKRSWRGCPRRRSIRWNRAALPISEMWQQLQHRGSSIRIRSRVWESTMLATSMLVRWLRTTEMTYRRPILTVVSNGSRTRTRNWPKPSPWATWRTRMPSSNDRRRLMKSSRRSSRNLRRCWGLIPTTRSRRMLPPRRALVATQGSILALISTTKMKSANKPLCRCIISWSKKGLARMSKSLQISRCKTTPLATMVSAVPSRNTHGPTSSCQGSQSTTTRSKPDSSGTNTIRPITMQTIHLQKWFKGTNSTSSTQTWLIRTEHPNSTWRTSKKLWTRSSSGSELGLHTKTLPSRSSTRNGTSSKNMASRASSTKASCSFISILRGRDIEDEYSDFQIIYKN